MPSRRCKIILDDGIVRNVVTLDSPSRGLFIKQMIWREMYDFSADCVLGVMADKIYDEADYIRNYQEFIGLVENNEKR